MFYHNIQNYIDLGFIHIRYYGLIYALGFILGYFFIKYFHKYFHLKLEDSEILDMILYLTLGIVIGARLFYCIFYYPSYFFKNPLQILFFWNGGLSFHGGLIGAIISGYIYSKNYNKSFFALADVVCLPTALALAFGRIGNLINGELYGRITSFPICIRYDNLEGCRHLSQIYASFKNLIIFSVLFFLKKKKFKSGTYLGIFAVMYSILRFVVGYFRAPDKQVGYLALGLTMGQWLNIIMFIFGIGFILYLYRKEIKNILQSNK